MTKSQQHNTALDGLRFFAFLFVFLFHANLMPTGHSGVWIFFVLSGFLIGRILLRQKGMNAPLRERLRIFYIRRSLRIFPLYYLVLSAFVLWQLFDRTAFLPHELLWEACYLTNIWRYLTTQIDISAHLWTLAIEEQFYILAPIIVLLLPLPRLARAYALYMGLLLIVFLGLLLQLRSGIFQYHLDRYYLLSFYEFGYLGLGVRVGMLEQGFRTRWFNERSLALAGQACLAVVLLCSLPGVAGRVLPYNCGWFEASVSIASGWIILGLWQERFPRLAAALAWPPFVYLGRISYGLYMYHAIVMVLLPRWFHHNHILVPVEFCLTLAIAALSWRWFENPINNLKERFKYRTPAPS